MWTIEKISAGFEKFKKEHDRYPTALEIDSYAHLPSSKQLQRRFGGLIEIRKQLKLDGPTDFTKGAHSSERARMIGKRAHKVEKGIYDYLVNLFGKPFVHREYFFTDDHRTRTDFFIYCKNGNFSVDVFYPKDKKNLIGCLNSKMKTYGYAIMINYPVIFLMMNEEITAEEINDILERKKNKLHKQQRVMTYEQFEQFCTGKTPLSVDSESIDT
jgi:uncharacterized short protein YbdD (DUF466 family)